MNASADILEGLLRPASGDSEIDRKALAALLVEIAQNLRPELRGQQDGTPPSDLQLEQLRTLLVGREIETLSRLTDVVDDPERLAAVIGPVLPTAIAQATSDARIGHVLAPVMEKAAESSIRNDPTTLVNILYPTIVPAIRKSIGETIDEMFQRINQALKYSLTWRGLNWRWEAFRTGRPFAEVVLRHTLIYQVEHVFLVHRHTGLLIAHVAAENAVSQDPQLVSSMLVAIQDFVRDSFSGAEHQGVDSVQLGELRLWSEPGPFALLVAVIRGDPPEGLHDTMRSILSRIHAERHQTRKLRRRQHGPRRCRGAAARTGRVWRAGAAALEAGAGDPSRLLATLACRRHRPGSLVVARQQALAGLSRTAQSGARDSHRRRG